MIYNIYRNAQVIAQVEPLDSSVLSQQKQVEDVINLNFESDTFVTLLIGDYIISDKTEQKYFLNEVPEVDEGGLFEYECKFEGSLHELSKTTVLLANDFNFPLTGNANTFLQFIVENLNRNGGSYVVGNFIDTEDLTVSFANWTVLEAIKELSVLLQFDWYLDGLLLHWTAKEKKIAKLFTVGLKSGFLKLTRSTVHSTKISTIVYGYGSTQNLPPRTGGEGDVVYNSPLLTENRLFFDGVNGESKLENNIDLLGRREIVVTFDEIKPQRTGTPTAVDVDNVQSFFDDALDFDINEQLMAGIKPKIQFISGDLLGITFDISYDTVEKKITMDTYTDDSGIYPNETLKPAINDEYKLFDIVMPQVYIDAAEIRLQEATQAYIDEHSQSMIIFEGEVDNEYIAANGISLDIGDSVRVVSGVFAIDKYYDIKGLVQQITNPDIYTVQFGDLLPKGIIEIIQQAAFNATQSIYTISSTQITNNDITNNIGADTSWLSL